MLYAYVVTSFLSVYQSACNNSAPSAQNVITFYMWGFLEQLSKKFKYISDRIQGYCTVHKYVHTFMIISRSILLKTWTFSDQLCTENQNIHFVFNNPPTRKWSICEIMGENTVQSNRPQMKIQKSACALHAGKLRQEYRHTVIMFLPFCTCCKILICLVCIVASFKFFV